MELAARHEEKRPGRRMDGTLPDGEDQFAFEDVPGFVFSRVAMGLHVWHWAQWQDRAKAKPVVEPTTTYGRPLARKA